MPMGIVDRLEIVQIKHEQRHHIALLAGQINRCLDLAVKGVSVGQAGKGIGHG